MDIKPIPTLSEEVNDIRTRTANIVAEHIIPNEKDIYSGGDKSKSLREDIRQEVKKEKLKNEPILIQKNLERKIEYVEMPNLIGKTVRDAFSELKRAGIKPQISGRGLIVSQSIEAGTKIEKKSICILKAELKE